MSGHYQKVCVVCKKIVEQCRCPSESKRTINVTCDKCAELIRQATEA